MIDVHLTEDEMVSTSMMGLLRRLSSYYSGTKDMRKSQNRSSADIDIDGYRAEYAFAKHFNVFLSMNTAPRSGSYDVMYKGKRWDIKSTRSLAGNLIVSLKDNPDVDGYILAILDKNKVTFVGYCFKEEICREEMKKELSTGWCYYMKAEELKPFR